MFCNVKALHLLACSLLSKAKHVIFVFDTVVSMHYFKTSLLAFTAGVAGALATYYIVPSLTQTSQAKVATVQPVRFTALSSDISLNKDFVEASQASTTAVVFIKTSSTVYNQMSWFDYYFYGGNPTQQRVNSGSGVIFSKNGYIVTNNHVIDKADKIEVIHEKRSYIAKLIGTDASTDIAVLKIEAENLPAIRIGSSKEVQVGEWVLAVGNPFNLATTVTAGIVSAKGRHVGVVNSRFPIESFIQTDAAINPGNSGGAGINTAIASQTGSYSGYSFAIPVNLVQKVMSDIIDYGIVQRGFLGVQISDISQDIKEKNIFVVLVNAQDQLLVEDEYATLEDVRRMAKEFIDNNGDGTCQECRGLRDPASSDNPGKAVISLQNDRGTSYNMFIKVRNELLGAYSELRNDLATRKYGRDYESLSESDKEEVNAVYPQFISEAEPVEVGG